MSLIDIFRTQQISGQIISKEKLDNGNLGIVVNDPKDNSRYYVEFLTEDRSLELDNFYGLIEEPYIGKYRYLDNLLEPGAQVNIMVGHSDGPIKTAYHLYSVKNDEARN